MRIFKWKRSCAGHIGRMVLRKCALRFWFADDDKGKTDPPAKPAVAVKVEAPAPLTERERLLLDRVEQLEKRVADLEGKGTPPGAASGADAAAVQPAATTPVASTAGVAAPGTTSAAKATSPDLLSKDSPLAVVQPQTTDKGNLATSKAPASEPFAFADFTWLNGNPRTKQVPLDTKFFTPEIRADVDYVYDFAHPKDDTIGGSSEIFRSNEVQVTQLGVGGDCHYDNVRARVMTQFGLYSETTPRNDASPARGQWNLADAYRYLSEAYGGYHFNVLHGVNVDAGIFMSYVGLFSYYQFDNWAYQPSYVFV